ncbi:MAG: VWA domain-containing protein, partial [Pyrinomonadaceae bacterium]
EMGQNDQAAISSASGQIGFLQQLTDNKAVLRAALNRLEARPYFVRDFDRPPMSEYQALAVERNNRDVIGYFVDELMKNLPSLPTIAAAQNSGGLPRSRAEQQVRDRASRILQQAANVTVNTLGGLDSLVRTASKLPGRKLVFFVSDGFFLDQRNSDSFQRLQRLTSAAAHSAVVIYAMDSRGLTTGLEDAGSEAGGDPSGRLQRIAAGALIESQDGMNAIANDTGGRAIFNTNALEAALPQALAETSAYYLLAWRPDVSRQASDQFRHIEVKVIGRPELSVRVRRGFFDLQPEPAVKQVKRDEEKKVVNPTEQMSEAKLRTALAAPFPQQMLPVSLNLSYVDTPAKGLTLTVALQVKREALSFTTENGKRKAVVYLAGAAYNDKGRAGASFGERLELTGPTTGPPNNGSDVVYTYVLNVPPGLYQVRAGARDEATGSIGSAQEW